VHIRFGKLRADRIGHYVYEYALMIAESELNNNSTIDIFCTHYPICNEQFDKMIRRRSFVRDWVRYLFLWNKAIPFGEKHNAQNNIDLDSRDLDGWLEKANVYFNFCANEELIVKEWLEKHHIQKENFVCMLIRDNAYLPDLKHHDYRNTNIDTYVNSCKMLADDGLKVIRMGKKMEHRIPVENTNIIDYAFLDDKSDLLDIWLFANCKFCISTGTGIDSISDVYRKPMLLVNHNPIGHHVTWSDCILVPKTLIWHHSNKPLTLKENLDFNSLEANEYYNEGISFIDLDDKDIMEAFKERYQRIIGTWVDTQDDINRQKEFWKIFKSWDEFPKYHGFIHPKAKVGSYWLRKMGRSFLQ